MQETQYQMFSCQWKLRGSGCTNSDNATVRAQKKMEMTQTMIVISIIYKFY